MIVSLDVIGWLWLTVTVLAFAVAAFYLWIGLR